MVFLDAEQVAQAVAEECAHRAKDNCGVRTLQIPVVLLHEGVVDPDLARLAERLERGGAPVQLEQVRDAFDMGGVLGRRPAAVFFLLCTEDTEPVFRGDIVAAFSALAWDSQVLRTGVRGDDLMELIARGQAEVAEILRDALQRPPRLRTTQAVPRALVCGALPAPE